MKIASSLILFLLFTTSIVRGQEAGKSSPKTVSAEVSEKPATAK
jgi:hypothetical protein